MSDPWAEFQLVSPAPSAPPPATDDPYAEFKLISPAPSSSRAGDDPYGEFKLVSPAPASSNPVGPPAGQSDEDLDPLGSIEPSAHENGQYAPLSNVASKALDLDEKLAQGITSGFAPRLGALADSDPIGKAMGLNPNAPSYADALAQRNATDQRISREMPVESKLAEATGGMLGVAVPGGMVANAVRDAGIVGRAGAGAVTGAALGGAQGASQSKDLTDLSGTIGNATQGAKQGAFLGALLPVAGSVAGSAYRAAAPFFAQSPAGLGKVASGLVGNAITPETADRLAALGSQGMLADTSPAALGLTQGVATKGGAAADIAAGNLSARAAGQSNRLVNSLDENLGPAFSPRQADAMMDARQAAASPMYERAFRGAPLQVDISSVQRQLDNEQLQAKGSIARDLDGFQRLIQAPYPVNGMTVPEYDARALHGAKEAMDVAIAKAANQSGSAASKATAAMSRVRGALNDALQDQVPGYRDANLAWGAAERGREAFGEGRQALKPGADTLWPVDLDQQFGALPLEQQAMMRAGARSDIAAQLGNAPNDLAALGKTTGGEGDFNRPKMATLFGPDQTANVIRDVQNERVFSDTYNKVAQGSQTAQRTGNASVVDSATPSFFLPKDATVAGLLGHGGEYLVRRGFNTLAQNVGDARRQQLASALTATGPQAASNLQDLAHALMHWDRNAATVRSVTSDPAALAAGLYAYRSATQ